MGKDKTCSTTEDNEVDGWHDDCYHDWHAMSDKGWKRCKKCGLAINYDEEINDGKN